MGVAALWFDGRSSRARPVQLSLEAGAEGPALVLQADGAPVLRLAHGQVVWPERFSARRAPESLNIDLHEHGTLQVDDPAAWHAACAAAGLRMSWAERVQTRWRVFATVLVTAVALLAAFYRWGTPWAAAQVTRLVPLSWEQQLSARALADLDGGLLSPSKLTPERQAQLRERFTALAAQVRAEQRPYARYAPPLTLQFRKGLGANAFALPGGTIVMTDGLVETAAKNALPDEALVGVLAHEIGHVMHRHTTRMVVEQGVLNVGLGLALGDMSWMFAHASSLLTALAYRRGHETQADCFALALLQQARVPTRPMADLLLAIDTPAAERQAQGQESSWANIVSSHPDTAGRARQLQAGHAAGCS
jgi:Zn-dependent protease with chaperone function